MPRGKLLANIQESRFQPVLLGIGFARLVSISLATLIVANRASDDADDLTTTLLVQDRLSSVQLAVRRAESGQRGYLLTKRIEYLEDWQLTAPRVPGLIDELRKLTVDDPALLPAVNQIDAIAKAKIAELATTIEMARGGDFERAIALVNDDRGRNLMDELRRAVATAIGEQQRIRAERTEANRHNNMMLIGLSLGGGLFIMVIGALSIFLVRRNARRAEAAFGELEGINANLERIVEFRTADLTEANEEIQRFAYIVSHDLRSPLVNIMGFTSELETLRQEIFQEIEKLRTEIATLRSEAPSNNDTSAPLGRDFDEAIGFIKTSIANMDRLINAVLRLSREGRRQFNPEQVDMNALIGGIAETVAHRVSELQATLRVDKLPPVETDLLAAQQIFGNLIDNALKYGRDDTRLEIAVSGRLTATHAIYDVQDNGRGIDRADFQRVFELFRRAGKQDRPGEGIGLAHVRALVRRMGGSMALKSEPGQGSTFTVSLPRRWSGDNRSAA